jgi:hypothetical protein
MTPQYLFKKCGKIIMHAFGFLKIIVVLTLSHYIISLKGWEVKEFQGCKSQSFKVEIRYQFSVLN